MRNKLKLMFIFICMTMVAVATISANAQGIGDRNRPQGHGNYRIVGHVYLPDGKPAADVTVFATSTDFNNASTQTDRDGAYDLAGFTAGNYNVSVKASGYQSDSQSLTFYPGTPGQSLQLVFHLRPSGSARPTNPLLNGIPKDAVAKFEKGMEKITNNDSKSAIAHFDEAIAAYPNFAAAYFEKGSALLKVNDLDSALESFVKAIQIKPDYLEAKYSVGYTQYLKKNYVVAAAVFDDVLKQKSDMPEAHMYLGISLYYLKNVNAAESQLRLATESKAGERIALAHRFLGGIYMQKKQNAAAAAELQKYLDLVPKTPDADKIKATIADLKKQG